MLGALKDHRMEDDETLSITAALPESHEFRGQRVHEAPPNSPAWSIVALRGYDHQCPLPLMPFIVVGNILSEVSSIIGLPTVSLHFLDLPILPCGYVTSQIPCTPLAVHPHVLCRPRLA